ncbi:MAG TPA: hypothetical protein VGU20_31125 [Stellaceae bacterium]|nr:hypothetical protein [Terriglobia bacterium]HEV2551804.1 hypothetical protein [Stellaceae bacterium]
MLGCAHAQVSSRIQQKLFVVPKFPEANVAPKTQEAADYTCLVVVVNAGNFVRRVPHKFSGGIGLRNKAQITNHAAAFLPREQFVIAFWRDTVKSLQVRAKRDLASADGISIPPTLLLRPILFRRQVLQIRCRHYFPFFRLLIRPALRMAIATACFCGLPAVISVLMLAETTALLLPD